MKLPFKLGAIIGFRWPLFPVLFFLFDKKCRGAGTFLFFKFCIYFVSSFLAENGASRLEGEAPTNAELSLEVVRHAQEAEKWVKSCEIGREMANKNSTITT